MKLKCFCMIKEIVSKVKRPPMEWEKIFVSYTSDKQLITRIHRELKKLNFPKISEPIKKWPIKLNRSFSKEQIQMAKKHMQKCTPSLAIMVNQNHTDSTLTPIRIATIKNTTTNKCWRGCREKGTLIHCRWGCKLV
jgi:hypothetical protein